MESVGTGAGSSEYFEEGFIDIADGLYSFRNTLPALVASSPHNSRLPVLFSLASLNSTRSIYAWMYTGNKGTYR